MWLSSATISPTQSASCFCVSSLTVVLTFAIMCPLPPIIPGAANRLGHSILWLAVPVPAARNHRHYCALCNKAGGVSARDLLCLRPRRERIPLRVAVVDAPRQPRADHAGARRKEVDEPEHAHRDQHHARAGGHAAVEGEI